MKKPTSLITYLAALVIGIILLVFKEQAGLFKGLVIAMGVLITVPSAIMFIGSFFGKKSPDGQITYSSWTSVIVAAAGLVLGIWMLVMPSFFVGATIYTLGVVLILCGAAQIVLVYNASRPYGANAWWYIVPFLVIAGGFIIIFLGPTTIDTWATITTGILLIVYAVNGIGALGREVRVERERRLDNDTTDAGPLSD